VAVFEDRARHATDDARRVALDCLAAGVAAAAPRQVIRDAVEVTGDDLRVGDRTYDLGAHDEVVVLGGGKAAAGVAAALDDALGDRLDGGVVVAPHPEEAGRVDVRVGAHPVPDASSVKATRAVLDRGRAAGDRTLVLAAVTGGGSALLAAPTVPLDAMRETTEALLDSGAPIADVNAVRAALSAVKGGGLARAAAPATVVTLLLSDVVGDDPAVVASGPTVPADTTAADARAVLERHGVDVPDVVHEALRGDEPRTDGHAVSAPPVHVLASGRTAVAAARDTAPEEYATLVLSSRFRGEARELGVAHAAVAEEVRAAGDPVSPPAVLVSGGEATVTVSGDGRGGPNQECALAAAAERPDCIFAAVDTDGRDGSTDAAGALVDGDTVADSSAARAALADDDAYPFLDERGALLHTGPTGTNVNDLRVLVVT
jgi:hydroxypyruvate reductase